MISFSSLPELSLYMHFPWCVRKCPYCDFNSHELRGDLNEDRYTQALIADLELCLPSVWGRPVVSIFMGGGTPSLFSARSIQWLLSEVRARLKVLPNAEITIEANPGTFEAQRFEGYALAGVNRISLGIQSFDDQKLKSLGRVHDKAQALTAARCATDIFSEVNLDLMYGLPEQTMDDLKKDLHQALDLDTTHLSVYQLTIEPNTAFASRPPERLPDLDRLGEMQDTVLALTREAGLERYEISAFAKPGHHCVHNTNYWTFGDYLGIGAGAHAKISSANRIQRSARFRHPQTFIDRALSAAKGDVTAVEVERFLEPKDLAFEFMLNALRLTDGVPVARWAQTTGTAVGEHPDLLEKLSRAQARGLLQARPDRWKASDKGLDFLSDLQEIFL